MKSGLGLVAVAVVAGACFSSPPGVGAETDSEEGSSGGSSTPTSGGPSGSGSATTTGEPTGGSLTASATSESEGSGSSGGLPECAASTCPVDIVVVVDNSATMAIEQRQIGLAMLPLEARLREAGYDAHVMFTTTDLGNPYCTAFQPEGYEPAAGRPITSACVDRLQDFTSLDGVDVVPEACTDVCPAGIAPEHPYVAFGPAGDNVPDVPDVDVDGDGTMDPAAAQALACLAPQGINGCGFESPLEAMLRALDPSAPWNAEADPFLRSGSTLAIMLVTDEEDCSIEDFTVMDNPTYQELDPDTGVPGVTSAICWNAGVQCSGGPGTYDDCTSASPTDLHELSRYSTFLAEGLGGRDVVMLGVVGVPSVSEHLDASPFTPNGGGVLDLVYRDWEDGEFPDGDILPAEWANGTTAADKQFNFGIGPGCTGVDAMDGYTGQAIPPVRLRELCESLDVGSDPPDLRCALESVCDGDYGPAIRSLLGLVDNTFQ